MTNTNFQIFYFLHVTQKIKENINAKVFAVDDANIQYSSVINGHVLNQLAIMTRAERRDKKGSFDFAIILLNIKHLNAICVFCCLQKIAFFLYYTYHLLTQEIEEKNFFSTFRQRFAAATLFLQKNA